MRTSLIAVAALAACLAAPTPAAAQIDVNAVVRFSLPAAPPLVVIQPGVQVVRDYDDEVFVHQGYYYARRGDRWYRGRGPQAEFVYVEPRLVPEPVRRLPPGHYRRWHPAPPPVRRVVVEERRLDKKEEKRLRKEAEKERREHERDHRDHDHDRGHGDRR